jgi:hypothetical protein
MTGCTSVRLDVCPIMDGVANECATHCNSGLFMQVNGVIVDHFVKIFFADISQIFRARIGTRPTKKYPAGTDRIDFTGLHARNVVLEIEDVGDVNLVTQSLGYLLNIESDSVDVHRFRRLFAEADNHDGPDRVAAVWDEALALWRGEPLTGITGSWVDKMRQSLREYLITAVVKHNETQLRAGQHAGMVGPLRGLVTGPSIAPRYARLLSTAAAVCDLGRRVVTTETATA